MTAGSALSAALHADTDHVVSFGRDGSERRWPELLIAASRVAARVAEAGGLRWALDLDDTFEFCAALIGCWAARKTPVLAPRTMLDVTGEGLAIDGVLRRAAGATYARRQVLWATLRGGRRDPLVVEAEAELVLYTSGSTGDPKSVTRRLRHVEAELAELESLFGGPLGTSRVYSTVSHRHVYGMLFRVLWPLLSRRPFAAYDLEYPEQLLGAHATGRVLVSSPALLKRIGHLSDAATWTAVFSSGGLLSGSAAADARRVLGVYPIEVFGSTETSGVAWRSQTTAHALRWRTMAAVETRLSPEGLLEVRSPFTGQPGWLQMGDFVRLLPDGTFELLGRGDHLAKIEDTRISLAEIERVLLTIPVVAAAAAVALEERQRQFVGAVVKLNAQGRELLEARGRRALGALIKSALREQVERVAVPRRLRYVEEIPVDSQGKRQPGALRDLLRSR